MSVPDLAIFIPLKPVHRAKRRLASILPLGPRRALTQHLFTHVVRAARNAHIPADVWVIAGDRRVARWARQEGVGALMESDAWRLSVADFEQPLTPARDTRWDVPLNRALNDALAWADHQGYQATLILPADLPHVLPQDVERLWHLSRTFEPPIVVIAPDRRGEGTNALLLRPPRVISPAFGQGSFTRHLIRAMQAGASVYIYTSPGVLHDLDTPEDWQHYMVDVPQRDHDLQGERRSP